MVRIRSSCWMAPQLLPREARLSHSRGALSFSCPSERTILSMQVLPRQCCSRPPLLARPILSSSETCPKRASLGQGHWHGWPCARNGRYPLGPYRSHRGHSENWPELNGRLWPRWVRYGGMKEASSIWHEAAMDFELMAVVIDTFGWMSGDEVTSWNRGRGWGLLS